MNQGMLVFAVRRIRVSVQLLFVVACLTVFAGAVMPVDDSPPLDQLMQRLQSDDVQDRRQAAIEARAADSQTRTDLLPLLSELLIAEKDGQVRLAVFDVVTDMGPSAEATIPALVRTLQTDYGGNYNEERHQDYRAAMALASIGAAAVPQLRTLLSQERENVRAESAMSLGRIGPRASAAIPDLLMLLADEKQRVRHEASEALGQMGVAALEPLLTAATDESSVVRSGAMQAMGHLLNADPRVSSVLLAGAQDADASVRAHAVRSFSRLPNLDSDHVRILLENLRHSDSNVHVEVVRVLADHDEILPRIESELISLLFGAEDSVAWQATFLLQRAGIPSAPVLIKALENKASRIDQLARGLALLGPQVVELLSTALDDPEARVRQGASLALGQIRPLPGHVVELLTTRLDDSDRDVQKAALRSIGLLGIRARRAVEPVRQKLHHESAELRKLAIETLFQTALHDQRFIDQLAQMLKDPDPEVQVSAIKFILASGSVGRVALPEVIDRLRSRHTAVQMAAAEMIGSHGRYAAAAEPLLRELVRDSEGELQLMAIETLSELGELAQPAFEELAKLIHHSDGKVRNAVVRTTGHLGIEPAQLRSFLGTALVDQDEEVRRSAVRSIRRLGRGGSVFLPELILAAASSPEEDFAERTFQAFERDGVDPQVVVELIPLLRHDARAVRLSAIKFLGIVGTDAATALSELKSLGESQDEEIRTAVEEAILRIRPMSTE